MSARGSRSAGRTIITVVMDVMWVWAAIVVAHLVITFFGALAGADWGKAVLGLTRLVVLPFPLKSVITPYGGHFDVAATVTIVLLLGGEWVLGMVRRTA